MIVGPLEGIQWTQFPKLLLVRSFVGLRKVLSHGGLPIYNFFVLPPSGCEGCFQEVQSLGERNNWYEGATLVLISVGIFLFPNRPDHLK